MPAMGEHDGDSDWDDDDDLRYDVNHGDDVISQLVGFHVVMS